MAASTEMMCAMAALILKDANKEISGDSITAVLKAAGVEFEAYWPKLFAKALEGVDVGALMTAVGSAPAGGAAAASSAAAAAPAAAAAESKKEEKKEEPEEEEDDDMGFSLFD